ncbi:replication protein DnaD [Candidatus Magnetomorum sp. HK-1]|nr:replication protein DnaD [Candidatus Magnetomorum sp. HK-1]
MNSINEQQGCSINPVCDQMKYIKIEGNITPISWYSNILTKKGKADTVAITILADILYWYRPFEDRDETTGGIIGYKQKFKADKLQKSYDDYSNLFNYTKRQVKQAIDNLCDQNLLTREFRHIKISNGRVLSNVMYLEPVIDKIQEITYKIRAPQKLRGYPYKNYGDIPSKNDKISPQKMGGYPLYKKEDIHPKKRGVSSQNQNHIPTIFGETYTYNTTKNTSKNTTTTTAAVSYDDIIKSIPETYLTQKALSIINHYTETKGCDYVLTEVQYTFENSKQDGKFNSYLAGALKGGWGNSQKIEMKQIHEAKLAKEKQLMEKARLEQQKMLKEEARQIEDIKKNVAAEIGILELPENDQHELIQFAYDSTPEHMKKQIEFLPRTIQFAVINAFSKNFQSNHLEILDKYSTELQEYAESRKKLSFKKGNERVNMIRNKSESLRKIIQNFCVITHKRKITSQKN